MSGCELLNLCQIERKKQTHRSVSGKKFKQYKYRNKKLYIFKFMKKTKDYANEAMRLKPFSYTGLIGIIKEAQIGAWNAAIDKALVTDKSEIIKLKM